MILLEVGVKPLSFNLVFFWVCLGLVTGFLYINRNSKLWGGLWQMYKLFWGILLLILTANFAKKEIKEWWNKD